MYEYLEESFKKRANYSDSKRFFLFTALPWFLVFFLIGMFVIDPIIESIWLYFYFWAYTVSYIFIYYLYLIMSIRKNPEFKALKFRDIFIDPIIVVKIYKKQVRNKDITCLLKILLESDMNSKHKLVMAIKHYQFLMPQKTISGSPFFSLIAIAISIFSLTYSDKVFNDGNIVRIFVIIIIGIVLLFLYLYFFNKIAYKIIGKQELYIKLEGYLSSIYMKMSPNNNENYEDN